MDWWKPPQVEARLGTGSPWRTTAWSDQQATNSQFRTGTDKGNLVMPFSNGGQLLRGTIGVQPMEVTD